jgi:hypothetical protein
MRLRDGSRRPPAGRALGEAQNMPPGPERTEAFNKATKLHDAADTYKYIFSSKLKPPE